MTPAGITDQTPDPLGGQYDRDAGRNLGGAYETAQAPVRMAALPTVEACSSLTSDGLVVQERKEDGA
jgi:hypothetical protein